MSLYIGRKKYVAGIGRTNVSGTYNITSNGTYDIAKYANVNVNVPQGPTPTGTINITSNGTYDVTDKATAVVNVDNGLHKGTFYVASDTGSVTVDLGFSGCTYIAVYCTKAPDSNHVDSFCYSGTTGMGVLSRYRRSYNTAYGADTISVSFNGTRATFNISIASCYFQGKATYQWIAM